MQGCGRRSGLTIGFAVAAVAVALASTTQASLAAANPLSLNLQVGYHNNVKLGQWMPVTVDITNSGPDFEGSLEVQATNPSNGGPPIGVAIYQAPVSLAGGATKHFRTYVSEDFPAAVQATLVQNGRAVASQTSNAASTFSGLMVGIVSDQPSTLDGMSSLRPGGTSPLVVHLAATEVSDSAPILRAFDVLAFDDFATDGLTAGQKTALTDYVTQGGALFLGTGGSWHKTLGGLPAGLVPMQVSGSRVLASAAGLGGARNVEIATGSLAAGATAWLTEGDVPLIVEQPVGKGVVTMATFDWAQDGVAGANGLVPVLRQALVRSTYGNLANPAPTGPTGGKFGTGSSLSLATKGGAMSQALGNLPALDLPAWWLIGTLVVVYVALVGPVNYFVLRATGRRALAWITVPAIALVASAGAYGTSVVTKGTSVLANEVSVIHVELGADRAYQEEYTGIMTPTRGDYQVAVGSGRMLIGPIYYYTGIIDPNLVAMRVNTVTSDVTLPGMTAFTLRAFANEGVLAGAPRLAGQAQMEGGQLTGSITNSSPLQFTDGVVISGNAYQKLSGLAPGRTVSFSLQPSTISFNGPPAVSTIYPSNYQFNGVPPNNPSSVERQMEIRSAVISTLIPNAFGGMPQSTRPMVVLWTQQSFQDVLVNGAHPRTFVESAVVLTLPIERVGAGTLPAGVVQGRLVDIDADTTSGGGPPGMVVAQKGSLIYSFSPALAPGTTLTDASITNVNPFGAKGYIGPTGTAAVVKAQAWDWSRAAWADVAYNESGATIIPSSAVNPTTGEVRLELSSDGAFATGWLSLSGTVR